MTETPAVIEFILEKLKHAEYGLKAREYTYGPVSVSRRCAKVIPCPRDLGGNAW